MLKVNKLRGALEKIHYLSDLVLMGTNVFDALSVVIISVWELTGSSAFPVKIIPSALNTRAVYILI